MIDPRIPSVLAAYTGFTAPKEIRPVGGDRGFSGAEIWRVSALRGDFALRAWHVDHPSPQRLRWIHAVLAHVIRKSRTDRIVVPVPLPVSTVTDATFVEFDDRCWELAPWMRGEMDEQTPLRHERLVAAFMTLARLHQTTADFSEPCPGSNAGGVLGVSPGMLERHQLLTRWMNDGWETLSAAVRALGNDWPRFSNLASAWLALAKTAAPQIAAQLVEARRQSTFLQPCLRDIKRDHLLFTDNEVTGIVDFGALRPESVSADIARLAGSLAADPAKIWQVALAAYETIRPLTAYERWLIDVFDRSGLLLGGGNWVAWVAVQKRVFSDRVAVEARLAAIVQRLELDPQRR